MNARALLLLLLLLAVAMYGAAACVPSSWESSGAPPSDPYVQRGAAEGAIQATDAARIAQAADATREAARAANRTENEIALLMAPLQASQTAISIGNEQARATDIAAQATATAGAQLATATVQAQEAASTQRAVDFAFINQQWEQSRRQKAAEFYDVFWPIVVSVAVFMGMIGLCLALWRAAELFIRRLLMRETKSGAILIYTPRLGEWRPMPKPDRQLTRLASAPARAYEQVTPFVARSPVARSGRDLRALAHALVLDAISIFGSDAKQIPSCDELVEMGKNWNDDKRNAAVRALEQAGALYTMVGKGTYLKTDLWRDLGELEADLHADLVHIPTTLPMAGD